MDNAAPPWEWPAAAPEPDADGVERPPVTARAPHPQVKTFDIFDTLIARRCIEPFRIFDMVAEIAGLSAFSEARRRAEASVAHQPYDLNAIYVALAAMMNLSEAEAEKLRLIEIDLELENVVPVAENIAAVADGDILISDMYLGPDIIRRLLDRAGFQTKAALVVTSDGKHSGRIWPLMLDKFTITEHLGDNWHSDNVMPNRFGIKSRHTLVTAPNVVEKVLLDVGLLDLARICREVRLVSWSNDPSHRALQIIQASLNVPILLLASIVLVRLMQRRGLSKALFSSRDCNLWLPLFRVVAKAMGVACEADYFYTSRLTRTRPSEDYLAYARRLLSEEAIVVDVCGTGWSLAHLFETLGLKRREMFFLHKMPPVALYEERAPTPAGSIVHALLEGFDSRWHNMTLEMCNYAEHGMVVDVRRVADVPIPVFSPEQGSAAIQTAIATQRACCLEAAEIVPGIGLAQCLALDDTAITTLCGTLYEGLSSQQILYALFSNQHLTEDRAVMQTLVAG